jgi:DNA-binding NarL/FixJ family response regulator
MNAPNTELRILLVEDHHIVREGLRALIDAQDNLRVVGQAANGVEAVQAWPKVFVLALTAHEDSAYVESLLSAGASGYILKRAAAADLVRAIHAVAADGMYLDPAIAGRALSGVARRASAASKPARGVLSDREAAVLRMIAQGHTMKAIAVALELSPRTLETYKARAMDKLELGNRADIVRYALQQGWL